MSQMREIMHIEFTESHTTFRNKSIASEDLRAQRFKSLPFTFQAQEFLSPIRQRVYPSTSLSKTRTNAC